MADESPSLTQQAQGILVSRAGCTFDEALMALASAARGNELTIDEMAQCLVGFQALRTA